MRIKDLRDKLYSKKSAIKDRPFDYDPLDPRNIQKQKEGKDEPQKKEWEKGDEVTRKQKKLFLRIIIGTIILLISLLASYAFYVYKKSEFSPNNLILSFDVPEAVDPGQAFSFNLLYHNNNRIDIKDCQIKINHPASLKISKSNLAPISAGDDFIVFDLGDIAARGNGSIDFQGTINEKEETVIYLDTILTYKKKNDETSSTKEIKQGIKVLAAKITLILEATRQVVSGEIAEYLLKIKNSFNENLNGIEVQFTFPQSFTYTSSSLEPANAEKNIYKFASIASGESTEIKVVGSLTGSAGEIRNVSVKVGTNDGKELTVLSEESAQTEMIGSPLVLSQILSASASGDNPESINSGEEVRVKIHYKNTSDLPLREAVITGELAGKTIDYNSVIVTAGNFNLASKKIFWRAGEKKELSVLEPQEEGDVFFEFRLLSRIPSETLEDKNFEVSSLIKIDSPDIPTPIGTNKVISSDNKIMKVNSKVLLESAGFYNDNVIPNEGPIPPKVGAETSYTIHWEITNVNNELNNAIMKASVPDYVIWKNNFFPKQSQEITFNERTREITWKPGIIPAFCGTQLEVKEAVFQIAISPEDNQVGKNLTLLKESSFSATDSFTQNKVQLTGEEITTELKTDLSITQGMVVK